MVEVLDARHTHLQLSDRPKLLHAVNCVGHIQLWLVVEVVMHRTLSGLSLTVQLQNRARNESHSPTAADLAQSLGCRCPTGARSELHSPVGRALASRNEFHWPAIPTTLHRVQSPHAYKLWCPSWASEVQRGAAQIQPAISPRSARRCTQTRCFRFRPREWQQSTSR